MTAAIERWALVPLRLVLGWGFVAHGYAKLARGLALIAGAFVRPVSLALAGVLVTALVLVHLPYGFSSVRLVEVTPAGARFGPVGYELSLVYLVGLAALAGSVPSPWSVD